MKNKLYRIYRYIFSRPGFIKINKSLFNLSIRGLGILNYETNYLSGEDSYLKYKLSQIARPVVFDVGANIGDYIKSIYLANPASIVYAFEPHPENIKRLREEVSTISNKNQISIINSAASDSSGQLALYDYSQNDGSPHASLYREVIEDIHHAKSIHHKIQVVTLDQFCDHHNIYYIDLLKIDTEGHELSCLQGAQNLLARRAIRAIQFEFNEMNIISHVTFKDFWDLLRGYRFFRLLPGGRLLPIEAYRPLLCGIYAYQNIVAELRN